MIVLAICGLPGCGKTTLAAHLAQWFQDILFNSSSFPLVKVIRLDDILYSLPIGHENYSRARQEFLNSILSQLTGDTSQGTRPEVLILDDTFHLRSMRREVYNLARDHGHPFIVINLRCAPSIAWEHNLQREGRDRVTAESFTRIVTSSDDPSRSDHPCDRFCYTLQDQTCTENYTPWTETASIYTWSREISQLSLFFPVLWQSICENVVAKWTAIQQKIQLENATLLVRSEQSTISELKLIDEAVRKVVRVILSDSKISSVLTPEQRSSIGRDIAQLKAKFLTSVRSSIQTTPIDCTPLDWGLQFLELLAIQCGIPLPPDTYHTIVQFLSS